MEREFARLSTAYLSLQCVQRTVLPRTRHGSAELRTFSVKSRRVDLYPRICAYVKSSLSEGSAEGRQRACDALRRLEAYEQFCTPLPEELGGVKAYQGDDDVVEVQPIKRRVVVDLTGGPDSGNEQRERASGRRRSRARAATVKAEGEVSSVAAREHEEDLDDGGGDPKPAEDEDEDEDLDVGGGDPKPAEDEDEDELVGGRADSLTGYDAGRPAASSPIMNTVACAKAAAARVQQAEEHTCVAKEAERVARAIAAEASAEAKRLRGELRVSKRRCAAAEASLSAERDQLERARQTLANWRKGADERREHEAAQRWKQVVAAEKLAKRYEQLQNKNNEHMRKAQEREKGLRAENASLRRRLEAESLSQNQGKRDAKFFQQQLEAAKAQHTLQLQEAVSLARRQWSKKGGEELARKTQEVTSLTASLAREARIVAELRRALKDAEKAARGGSGGEVLRPSQREETLASRLSAAEARAAGAEALASDLQAANRALTTKAEQRQRENQMTRRARQEWPLDQLDLERWSSLLSRRRLTDVNRDNISVDYDGRSWRIEAITWSDWKRERHTGEAQYWFTLGAKGRETLRGVTHAQLLAANCHGGAAAIDLGGKRFGGRVIQPQAAVRVAGDLRH